MKVLGAALIVILVVGLCAFFFVIGKKRMFVGLEQKCQEEAAKVQTALQRRYDLIPNLVEVVKGYAKHEEEVFNQIATARASVGKINFTSEMTSDPEKMAAFQKAQGELSSAFSRLLVVSENYPNLKANEGFKDLQTQLEGSENRIKTERDNYNRAVTPYNTAIDDPIDGLFAGGRKKLARFEASAGAENAPKVSFGK